MEYQSVARPGRNRLIGPAIGMQHLEEQAARVITTERAPRTVGPVQTRRQTDDQQRSIDRPHGRDRSTVV